MVTIWDYVDFEKSKQKIGIEANYREYYRRKSTPTEKNIFTIILPYECLRDWDRSRQKVLEQERFCSFVDILNAFFKEKTGLKIKEDCVRVEERIRRACSDVRSKLKGKSGNTYMEILSRTVKVAVIASDLASVEQLEIELAKQKSLVEELSETSARLLDESIESKSAEKIASEKLNKVSSEMKELMKENEKLATYVEKLGQDLEFANYSKTLMVVGERQQRRKMQELKTKVQRALWFSETFGLKLESVNFVDEKGATRRLSYSDKCRKSYKDLPVEEQENIKSILYVLDKFCVGDAAYHELTMQCENGLPRSYLIKQCKDDLNKMCHITRTPGLEQGAQLHFLSELERVVQEMVRNKKESSSTLVNSVQPQS